MSTGTTENSTIVASNRAELKHQQEQRYANERAQTWLSMADEARELGEAVLAERCTRMAQRWQAEAQRLAAEYRKAVRRGRISRPNVSR